MLWPSLIGGLPVSAAVVRVTGTLMLEVLRQVNADSGPRAGLPGVLFRHGPQNDAPPLVTILDCRWKRLIRGGCFLSDLRIRGWTVHVRGLRCAGTIRWFWRYCFQCHIVARINLIVGILFAYSTMDQGGACTTSSAPTERKLHAVHIR